MDQGFKDVIIASCAVLGAILGVLNTTTAIITARKQNRLKLKVIPKMYLHKNGIVKSHQNESPPGSVPSIEIVNQSSFAVTIAEAGFTLKGEKSRHAIMPPLSRWLEPRESFTVYSKPSDVFPKNLEKAYAITEHGETREGDSPALKAFRALLRRRGQ